MNFKLDSRLADISVLAETIDDLQIRLVNDSRYFWLMIVPTLPDIVEIDDLPTPCATRLFRLASNLSGWLKSKAKADKINNALIGNVVPQLHLHIVARHKDDLHWPDPIWGRGVPVSLAKDTLELRIKEIKVFSANWSMT